MIHFITNNNHPSNPQQPIHSLRLAPVRLSSQWIHPHHGWSSIGSALEVKIKLERTEIPGQWCRSFFPTEIKHGLLENPPFIDDFPTKTSIYIGFSSKPCFRITRGYARCWGWMLQKISQQHHGSCRGISEQLRKTGCLVYLLLFLATKCRKTEIR